VNITATNADAIDLQQNFVSVLNFRPGHFPKFHPPDSRQYLCSHQDLISQSKYLNE